MSKRIHVKPRPGRVVRCRETGGEPLPEGGKTVNDGPFWRRREAASDVTVSSPGAKTPAKAPAKAAVTKPAADTAPPKKGSEA